MPKRYMDVCLLLVGLKSRGDYSKKIGYYVSAT